MNTHLYTKWWNSVVKLILVEKSMYVTKNPEITSGSLRHCKYIVQSKN